MEKAKIDRINYLAKKSRTEEGLTKEEKEEQAALRSEYLAQIRLSFGSMLDNTVIKRPDGSVEKLADRKK